MFIIVPGLGYFFRVDAPRMSNQKNKSAFLLFSVLRCVCYSLLFRILSFASISNSFWGWGAHTVFALRLVHNPDPCALCSWVRKWKTITVLRRENNNWIILFISTVRALLVQIIIIIRQTGRHRHHQWDVRKMLQPDDTTTTAATMKKKESKEEEKNNKR